MVVASMDRLERWETPFFETEWLSVLLLASASSTKVVVAPHGIDSYPKFVIDFGRSLLFRSFDEGCALGFEYDVETSEHGCSFVWPDSTWIKAYAPCRDPFGEGNFVHYLIYGGDNIVEVITNEAPVITQIDRSTALAFETLI